MEKESPAINCFWEEVTSVVASWKIVVLVGRGTALAFLCPALKTSSEAHIFLI